MTRPKAEDHPLAVLLLSLSGRVGAGKRPGISLLKTQDGGSTCREKPLFGLTAAMRRVFFDEPRRKIQGRGQELFCIIAKIGAMVIATDREVQVEAYTCQRPVDGFRWKSDPRAEWEQAPFFLQSFFSVSCGSGASNFQHGSSPDPVRAQTKRDWPQHLYYFPSSRREASRQGSACASRARRQGVQHPPSADEPGSSQAGVVEGLGQESGEPVDVTTRVGRQPVRDLQQGRATLHIIATNDSWGVSFAADEQTSPWTCRCALRLPQSRS